MQDVNVCKTTADCASDDTKIATLFVDEVVTLLEEMPCPDNWCHIRSEKFQEEMDLFTAVTLLATSNRSKF